MNLFSTFLDTQSNDEEMMINYFIVCIARIMHSTQWVLFAFDSLLVFIFFSSLLKILFFFLLVFQVESNDMNTFIATSIEVCLFAKTMLDGEREREMSVHVYAIKRVDWANNQCGCGESLYFIDDLERNHLFLCDWVKLWNSSLIHLISTLRHVVSLSLDWLSES